MTQNMQEDTNTSSTHKAIVRSMGVKVREINISEEDYVALQEIIRMRTEQKHTPIQFYYRDNKLHCQKVQQVW